MDARVFDFTDPLEFLEARLHEGGRARKGSLSALANAIPCQVSYLSRVMSGAANLSSEQADSIGHHFGLSADENYYFVLLVQRGRAGTASLRAQLTKRIDQAREDRLNLQKRTGVKDTISVEDQVIYYSSWSYAAVHVATGIPGLQTRQALSEAIHIPLARVTEILEFLVSIGLVKQTSNGRFTTGLGKIHLKKNSPMILSHHANWRYQAIQDVEKKEEASIHYSVLVNTSRKDAELLRVKIGRFIEDFMRVVHPSPDEETNCFSLDFFHPRG